jgi:PPP family 3-phenylpropionic acid transporter
MPVAAFYFALFMAAGVLIPYLPPFLRSQGLGGAEIGALGAIPPALSLVAPPVWGFLADRLQDPARVLRIVAVGAAIAFTPLLAVRSFPLIAATLVGYAAFNTALTPLADSIAMVEARRLGTEYARLRLWGSLGYIVSSSLFGVWLAQGGAPGTVVVAVMGLLLLNVGISRAAPRVPATLRRPSLADAARLAADPRLLLFLAGNMLHWAAAAPFHQFYAIHLRDLGVPASFVGLSIAAAVGAEVLVMWRFRSLARRLPLFAVLLLSYAAGGLRWVFTAQAHDGPVLVALQALHGLSYGAFLVASMAHLERTVPEELRATGRALFSAVVFGLGGILGMLLAGRLYDGGGGAAAFRAAATLELLAPLGLLAGFRLRRPAL